MHEWFGFNAEARDSRGSPWRLMLRTQGPASLWRSGEKIAEIGWGAIYEVLSATSSPDAAARSLVDLLALDAQGALPQSTACALESHTRGWLARNWERAVPDFVRAGFVPSGALLAGGSRAA